MRMVLIEVLAPKLGGSWSYRKTVGDLSARPYQKIPLIGCQPCDVNPIFIMQVLLIGSPFDDVLQS